MKRIFTIITGVVIVFSLTLTAFGASSLDMTTPSATQEGEIVSLTLQLTENPGVVSITVSITYPSSQLALLTAVDSGIFDSFSQIPGDGNVTLTFETKATNDNYYSGDIATVYFQVKDASQQQALVIASCDSAINNAGISVNFDSAIALVTFETDDSIDIDDDIDEEEEIIDEDEIIEDEPVVTTTATKKTEKTTTTEKTTKKTEKKTEATTTTVTTTTEATTTTASTTSEVTTTPEVTTTTESTSDALPSDSESSEYQGPAEDDTSDSSSDAIATGNDYSNRASGATVVLAVSVLITTVLLAGGIEVYKRFFAGDDTSQEG